MPKSATLEVFSKFQVQILLEHALRQEQLNSIQCLSWLEVQMHVKTG